MSRLSTLKTDFESVRDGIKAIERAAEEAGRDLTDTEQADTDALFERAEALAPEIEAEDAKATKLASVSQILSKVSAPVAVQRAAAPAVEMNAGEYLASYFNAFHPDGTSNPAEFSRAVAMQDNADITAIVPAPIVGDLFNIVDANRPVFNSFRSQPMPAGNKTFERPSVTTRSAVAEQLLEGDEFTSQAMVLDTETVSKRTFGSTLDLSRQSIDWSSGAALQLVLSDWVDTYAETVEAEAADHLEGIIVAGDTASNGSTYSPWVGTDVGTIVASIVDAYVAVYAKSKKMPDTIWMDLTEWASLTQVLSTNDDRTALSVVKEALANFGASVNFVVGPQLAAGTRIVGVGSLVESYERRMGVVRAELPSTWSVRIATAGEVAFFGKHQGFVQLGTDPSA